MTHISSNNYVLKAKVRTPAFGTLERVQYHSGIGGARHY